MGSGKDLESLAQELEELHEKLQDALVLKNEASIAHCGNARVEHLGHGVYVQYGVQTLDIDSLQHASHHYS